MEKNPPPGEGKPAPGPNNKKINRRHIFIVFILMLLAFGGVSIYYWVRSTYYVITEDAYIDGVIAKVTPQVSGRLKELHAQEGQAVVKDEVLGRQEDLTLPPGTNPDLALLRAPISGVVLKVDGTAGEVIVPGKPVAWIADPGSFYVTANIEETDLAKIKPGQPVELTVDSIPGAKFAGRVTEIGQAALSTFSLLPTRNPAGNFTKVVQRVPVKIAIADHQGYRLRPGLNVVAKIRVR